MYILKYSNKFLLEYLNHDDGGYNLEQFLFKYIRFCVM